MTRERHKKFTITGFSIKNERTFKLIKNNVEKVSLNKINTWYQKYSWAHSQLFFPANTLSNLFTCQSQNFIDLQEQIKVYFYNIRNDYLDWTSKILYQCVAQFQIRPQNYGNLLFKQLKETRTYKFEAPQGISGSNLVLWPNKKISKFQTLKPKYLLLIPMLSTSVSMTNRTENKLPPFVLSLAIKKNYNRSIYDIYQSTHSS